MPATHGTLLGDALATYYRTGGLPPDGGATSPTFRVRMGPWSFPVPNPPARRRAVFYHDVNHVVTGYDNVFTNGEMAIAGFEIGAGCGPFAVAWVINLGMWAFGLFIRPRSLFQAFVRGRRSSSIYRRAEDRETLVTMSVGEVRALMALDQVDSGVTLADALLFAVWSAVALLVLSLPVLMIGGIVAAIR